jgi:hypothetical protein
VSLISSFGETQHKLLKENEIGLKFIEFILYLSQHPSKKISRLTLDFWFSFQQSIESEDEKLKFKNLIKQMIQILIFQMKFNDELDEDELEDFRYYSCDTLLVSFNILFDEYFTLFHSLILKGVEQWNNQKDWKSMEVLLIGLAAVADSAKDPRHLKYLNPIFELFPKIPNEFHLNKSMIKLIGAYSEYIITLDSSFIVWCIQYCLFLFCNSQINLELAVIAGKVFVQLCENVSNQNEDFIKNLVKTCQENISKLNVFENLILILSRMNYQFFSMKDCRISFIPLVKTQNCNLNC